VAWVFAIVMACWISLFFTKLSIHAKTMTPSALAGPGGKKLPWWLQSSPGPKAIAFTDLLGRVAADLSIAVLKFSWYSEF